ncbi:MAG: DUF1003 domain-containing protein [Bacteroidetes bacterium]|nr:DUF1003 domain-containing protein [Bacteroidota bacterium]MBX7129011.1 DUF1003 domain-containing protein [Flavobacteriales bacterium]MCC6656304.1 DUF1003 domain-containing protein [Flavobacteriales bacterium]HMU14730.1 DUF1003 domain-containing protein [Flavobacteriales bacterium]HMZ48088.1 DUF1003 domain-containing protein [Flavobacteriales bacterium]
MKKHRTLDELLTNKSARIRKLQGIVKEAMAEEKLIIESLRNPPGDILTRGQRISDRVARFGGSWSFIISFLVVLLAWILFNTMAVAGNEFDPYPFILMNLILSCIAALQAPIIMMSQNRQEEKDRQRAENDYLINLKAELEVRSLHQKMDMLLQEEIRVLFEAQQKQLAMLQAIINKLPPPGPDQRASGGV